MGWILSQNEETHRSEPPTFSNTQISKKVKTGEGVGRMRYEEPQGES